MAVVSGQQISQPRGKQVISRRQVQRALRLAHPMLAAELGQDTTSEVEQRLLREYAHVARTVPRLRTPMSRMMLQMAVDSLVLYRSLPPGLASDHKLALISRFVTNCIDGQFGSAVSRWIYGHRRSHLLLRRWWFWSANRADDPDGWRFRFIKDGPGLFYGVDVTRCGIVRFLAAQGALELGPLMCQADFQIARYLPPGVTFRRTQVMAEGAPFCDFRYLTPSS
jgi:hypothetical protein